jgi:AcrR family transcriptional regulator
MMNEQQPGAARRPKKNKAIERFDAILDVTARLLAELPDEDISLAQISDAAGVPLASLYHFFPNRNAAFVALAERYHTIIQANSSSANTPPPTTWQAYIEGRQRVGAAFLNDNPAALRLFMGAGVSVDVRNTDLVGNQELAKVRAAYLRAHFEMPTLRDLESKIAVSVAITDGIWALSYSLYKRITDEMLEESIASAILYLRRYLPEILERR